MEEKADTETPADIQESGDAQEKVEGEETAITNEEVDGEGIEEAEGEHVEGEHLEGETEEGEHVEGDENERAIGEGEELLGEELEGEHVEGEELEGEEKKDEKLDEEVVEEEEGFVEEPPPDPAAPYDFSDSKEALKEPFELRPYQLAEVEQLWELYQNYTPVYTDIDAYITEKELVYMLKALLIMTYTPEQMQELIEYCVRPPHPQGHITYEQFLKMVTMRQRDFPIEEELRSALQVLDPDRTGEVNREELKELLSTKGHKMPQKQLDNLIKEVDMSNDGTIGIEDVVGTMCIDLNKEDLQMLLASIYPNPPEESQEEQF
jgi:Ca2+-binding EF-hand superfamily protein